MKKKRKTWHLIVLSFFVVSISILFLWVAWTLYFKYIEKDSDSPVNNIVDQHIDIDEILKQYKNEWGFPILRKEQFVIILARTKNFDVWKDFWQMDYETNDFIRWVFPKKEDFLAEMNSFYQKIQNNLVKYKEENHDLAVIFSSEDLKTSLSYCDNPKDSNLTMPIHECTNWIYLFRATKDNNLCEKIENSDHDTYNDMQICLALINYLQ